MVDIENIVFDPKTINDAYLLMEQNVLTLKGYLNRQSKKIITVNLEDLSHGLQISPEEIRDSAAVLLYMGFIHDIETLLTGEVQILLAH